MFAIVQGTPSSEVVELDLTPGADADVRLLGHDAPLPWEATADGCRVTLPCRPADAPALVVRLSSVDA